MLIPFLLQEAWFVMASDPDLAEEGGGSRVFEISKVNLQIVWIRRGRKGFPNELP
jgi:hypothetical protein